MVAFAVLLAVALTVGLATILVAFAVLLAVALTVLAPAVAAVAVLAGSAVVGRTALGALATGGGAVVGTVTGGTGGVRGRGGGGGGTGLAADEVYELCLAVLRDALDPHGRRHGLQLGQLHAGQGCTGGLGHEIPSFGQVT